VNELDTEIKWIEDELLQVEANVQQQLFLVVGGKYFFLVSFAHKYKYISSIDLMFLL
jgi:hypothetical protein